jgi:thymidylate synthase (FAD)
MEVTLLEATQDPERLICRAARNDYMEEFVGDQSFERSITDLPA